VKIACAVTIQVDAALVVGEEEDDVGASARSRRSDKISKGEYCGGEERTGVNTGPNDASTLKRAKGLRAL
jgi:hypothetical protein